MTERIDHQTLAPQGMRALGGVYQYVLQSGLPKVLVDLVYLRASQINGCAYCISAHSEDLMKAGVPPRKLLLLSAWREAGASFTNEERAALQWTESVTLVSQTHASDEDFAAAAACFTPKQIVDLTLAIGLINTYNRLAIGMRRSPSES